MFVLTILEKNKQTRLKFSEEGVADWKSIANYEEIRLKVTNNQFKKPTSAGEKKSTLHWKKTRKTFKMKNFLINHSWQQVKSLG